MPSTMTDRAIATRDLAKRARRLAGTVTTSDDAARLLRYAEELEAQAVDLDGRAKEGGVNWSGDPANCGLAARW